LLLIGFLFNYKFEKRLKTVAKYQLKLREENQLEATEWLIALIICYASGMREATRAASLIPDA